MKPFNLESVRVAARRDGVAKGLRGAALSAFADDRAKAAQQAEVERLQKEIAVTEARIAKTNARAAADEATIRMLQAAEKPAILAKFTASGQVSDTNRAAIEAMAKTMEPEELERMLSGMPSTIDRRAGRRSFIPAAEVEARDRGHVESPVLGRGLVKVTK